MKLGERLRLIRKQHKLTLKDLKERSDLSVPYLSDIERGVVNPSIDTLQKVAKAYTMTVQELITGVDEIGESARETYPEGFSEFLSDTDYEDEIDDDWKEFLMRLDFRGRKPASKKEWVELHLHLRRIFSSGED